jgi:hypothetical protein
MGRDGPMRLVVVCALILELPTVQPDRAAGGTSALLGCKPGTGRTLGGLLRSIGRAESRPPHASGQQVL